MISAILAGGLLLGSVPDADSDQTRSEQLKCGVYCLYVALAMLDRAPASIDAVEQRLGQVTPRGYSMRQLIDAAEQFGVTAIAVQTTPENLLARRERFACIALLKREHFVLVSDIRDGQARVIDPPGANTIPLHTLLTQWDGTAVLIADEPLEPEERLTSRLRRAALADGLLKSLAAVVVVILGSVGVWAATRRRTKYCQEES